MEHIRCLRKPRIKDADKPRYKLLRPGMSKLRFLPALVCATIGRTLAAEAVAIAMEAPVANTRDIQCFINGKTG
eukprot:12071226-Heterocapsa_arctica.AAC.1